MSCIRAPLLLLLAVGAIVSVDGFTAAPSTSSSPASSTAFVPSNLFSSLPPLASSTAKTSLTQQKPLRIRKKLRQQEEESSPSQEDSSPTTKFTPVPPPTSESRSTASSSSATYANRHSSKDWWYNLRSLPQSSVLREVRNPVMSVGIWGLAVSVLYKVLPAPMAAHMVIPTTAHSFLTSALGLLLVFRTNSAYQRFLEGRKIWEEILTITRNFSRMVRLYEDAIGEGRAERIRGLVAAFPYLLRHHIRSDCLCKDTASIPEEDYRVTLREASTRRVDTRFEGDKHAVMVQTPHEPCHVDRRDLPWCLLDKADALPKIARSQNRPLWVCDRLGKEIVGAAYDDRLAYTSRERLALLANVDKLAATIGQCERIHHTAVPLNYARHALRSLTLFLFTLPFCLVKDLGLVTGPAVAISAWLLFGVYQIGHSIEDPFQGSLRLSTLCDAIRRDVVGHRASAFEIPDDDEDDDDGFVFPANVSEATKEVEKFIFTSKPAAPLVRA